MIDVKREQRVVQLKLNAPPVNVLDSTILSELTTELRRLAKDDEIAAVLLSGEGRCFSAGASVAEHKQELAPAMIGGLLDACEAIAELPAPVVALVHGACLGGAPELISFCDFVVADPAASFGQPEIKLAFFPPIACAQLPRHCGLQNAAFAVLTGEALDAERAMAIGMVQKLLAKDSWNEIESLFNSLSVPVLRLSKQALRIGSGGMMEERLHALKELFLGPLYQIKDVQEGIASFEERRKPSWTHR